MSKQLKLRRGTTAQHSTFTGAEGEVTVDTTKDTLVVHDGTTAGGIPLATEASLAGKQPLNSALTAISSVGYNGFKNRIINGAMMIDQRNAGASVTPASDGYTLDRWFISGYGTGLNSTSIQRLSAGVVSGFSNYLRMRANSTSGTNLFLSHSIETSNCYDLAGQSVTVSFWYRINTNFTNACTVLLGSSTSADTKIAHIGGTTASLGTLTNTSTWTKFTATVTVPSSALTVSVIITNGYNNVVNGANIDITGVQLEKGSTATSFDYRPYGTELALCQRYYYRTADDGSTTNILACAVESTTTVAGTGGSFPVQMRVVPTATLGSGIRFYSVGSGNLTPNIGSNRCSSTTMALGLNITGGTTGQAGGVYKGSSNGYIEFSAEL